jgi:hypothetical protein
VVDSSRSWQEPQGTREYFFNKYISAAIMTFTPWKNLDFSIGNSVISCSNTYNPAYLSPFLFYTNVSSTGDSSQKAHYGRNSQLFFNLSSRQIKHLHLYASLFIDELGTNKFHDGVVRNCISWKAGLRASNLLNQNLTFTGEYTRTTPKTYSDPVSTLTFESNLYNLGSYLRDNSQEVYTSLTYRPLRGLSFNLSCDWAEHGSETDAETLHKIVWTSTVVKMEVIYEIINNTYVRLAYEHSSVTEDPKLPLLSPAIFIGDQNIVSGGINIGF